MNTIMIGNVAWCVLWDGFGGMMRGRARFTVGVMKWEIGQQLYGGDENYRVREAVSSSFGAAVFACPCRVLRAAPVSVRTC